MVFQVIQVLVRILEYLKRKFRMLASAMTPGLQVGTNSQAAVMPDDLC